jgi:hypothetical protein
MQRLLDCYKILEEAGDRGVLKTRALDDIKSRQSAPASKKSGKSKKVAAAKETKKKIETTGIFAPNEVFGQPVDMSIARQSLQEISDTINLARVADLEKRHVVCPYPGCLFRWTDRKYMQPHFLSKHPGFDLSTFHSHLTAEVAPGTAVVAEAAAAGGGGDPEAAAAAGGVLEAAAAGAGSLPKAAAAGGAVARKKHVHAESEYVTCALCGARYLKASRFNHITSGQHQNAVTAAAASLAAAAATDSAMA